MDVDIFVSYSSKEKEVTEYVCSKLEKAGLQCWMAHRDIPVGSDYAEQIPDAIANCKVFLILMSDHAQKSKYVRRELNEAVDREKWIIPFYIKKTELNNSFQFLLKQNQHIEGYNNQANNTTAVAFSYGSAFSAPQENFGLRDEAIEQLIKQVKTYLGYPEEDPNVREPVELSPPQPPVIAQSELPKRYRKKKRPIVCPKCSDGNLKKTKYLPEVIASELSDHPAAIAVFCGAVISLSYLLIYAIINTSVWSSPVAETTPVVETMPIVETTPIVQTIPIGEKLAAIGVNILTGVGHFIAFCLWMLYYLMPLVLLIGIVSFGIYIILRMYNNHFTMIKKSKMRIWSFQCCSCMHKFTIITPVSDNLGERVPNLVKKPRRRM